MTQMHFQYITELYADRVDRRDVKWRLEKWLTEHVGREGTAREPFMDFAWAWSLTNHDLGGSPNGIYFVNEEDKLVFRLTFGLGHGRL
jgi:hypothetical protein